MFWIYFRFKEKRKMLYKMYNYQVWSTHENQKWKKKIKTTNGFSCHMRMYIVHSRWLKKVYVFHFVVEEDSDNLYKNMYKEIGNERQRWQQQHNQNSSDIVYSLHNTGISTIKQSIRYDTHIFIININSVLLHRRIAHTFIHVRFIHAYYNLYILSSTL